MEIQTAKQRMIKDIKNDDVRIQVTGYVKDHVENDNFILDDTTGKIKVSIKDFEFHFKNEDLVNVIGDLVIQLSGDMSVEPQFIQDMNKLNFTYYEKLYEIKKELLNQ
ncbi:MAG: hypothetical protein ACFFBP_17885 [Promethearchaeota archaeon]